MCSPTPASRPTEGQHAPLLNHLLAAKQHAAVHVALVGKLGAAALDTLLHVDGVAQGNDVCTGWIGCVFEVFEELSELPGLKDAWRCDRHPLLYTAEACGSSGGCGGTRPVLH